jgi:hypothetical protein
MARRPETRYGVTAMPDFFTGSGRTRHPDYTVIATIVDNFVNNLNAHHRRTDADPRIVPSLPLLQGYLRSHGIALPRSVYDALIENYRTTFGTSQLGVGQAWHVDSAVTGSRVSGTDPPLNAAQLAARGEFGTRFATLLRTHLEQAHAPTAQTDGPTRALPAPPLPRTPHRDTARGVQELLDHNRRAGRDISATLRSRLGEGGPLRERIIQEFVHAAGGREAALTWLTRPCRGRPTLDRDTAIFRLNSGDVDTLLSLRGMRRQDGRFVREVLGERLLGVPGAGLSSSAEPRREWNPFPSA